MSINIGDKVTFNGGRRGKQEGVVAEIKYPQLRMTKKLRTAEAYASALGVSLPSSIYKKDAMVMVNVNGAVWKVPVKFLTVVGTGNATEAKEALQKQLVENGEAKYKQRQENWDKIDTGTLNRLKRGDSVMVTYTNGTKRETFVKFLDNGKVGVYCPFNKSKVRYVHPGFVKLADLPK